MVEPAMAAGCWELEKVEIQREHYWEQNLNQAGQLLDSNNQLRVRNSNGMQLT